MTPEAARFILSQGRQALNDLCTDPQALRPAYHLESLRRLRRRYDRLEAAALMEVAVARARACRQQKFDLAGQMFFTRIGLEQSSSQVIADWCARRISAIPTTHPVVDLCCGIGAVSIALAARHPVVAVDLDAAALIFARANADLHRVGSNFQPVLSDVRCLRLSRGTIAFFDPSRRGAQGQRQFSVTRYSPPLSTIDAWIAGGVGLGVKVSPGVDLTEVAGYDCEVEFISERGELKEALLWFGVLRQPGIKRRATLMPQGLSLTDRELRIDEQAVAVTEPRAFVYEPDPAVIRAGLIGPLALRLGALSKLDETIAYLTGDSLIETPFLKCYRLREAIPFGRKLIARRMRELGVGRLIVKKRGLAVDPPVFIRSLKLRGEAEATLILTRVAAKPYALLCDPLRVAATE